MNHFSTRELLTQLVLWTAFHDPIPGIEAKVEEEEYHHDKDDPETVLKVKSDDEDDSFIWEGGDELDDFKGLPGRGLY